MDEVFKALADASRRRLLDSLRARNGQSLRELCAGLDMARQSVSKHLEVLEAANLVTTVWRGREKLHYLNAAPISDIAERWINQYDQERIQALGDLKRALEGRIMQQPEFVYTTYIRTTPEQLWQALIEPAFTRRYWKMTIESKWQVGAAMTWSYDGGMAADAAQVVLEYEPYRRLSYTWPPLGSASEPLHMRHTSEATQNTNLQEPLSKVTFTIEPLGEIVKLTVIHDDFAPGSIVIEQVNNGWPRVLSSLKSLLETGETIPTF